MSTATTRANYDRMSGWYDLFASSEKRFTRAGLELLQISAGQQVLEIGCGTGQALARLAARGARVVGVDLSGGMLAQAARALGRRPAPGASLCQADALALPFGAGSFEAIFTSFTLELFPDEQMSILLKRCRELLCPDGQLVVVALASGKSLAVRIYEHLHRLWPELIDCRPVSLGPILAGAGFQVRRSVKMSMWGLPVEILSARKA